MATENLQPEELTGFSNNLSFEEALRDAISQARTDLPTDFFRYVVGEIGYERGGIVQVDRLFVKIKRVVPG